MADSTRAYNAVLRACAARGHWQIARTFINRMTDQDVPADVTTFNALIMSALKVCDVEHRPTHAYTLMYDAPSCAQPSLL